MQASNPSMCAITLLSFTLTTNAAIKTRSLSRRTNSYATTTNAMVSLEQPLVLHNCQNYSRSILRQIITRSPLSEFHQQKTQQYDPAEPASVHRGSGAGRYDEWLWF